MKPLQPVDRVGLESGSEINFFLREPTGDYPKSFGRQMEGFGRQK